MSVKFLSCTGCNILESKSFTVEKPYYGYFFGGPGEYNNRADLTDAYDDFIATSSMPPLQRNGWLVGASGGAAYAQGGFSGTLERIKTRDFVPDSGGAFVTVKYFERFVNINPDTGALSATDWVLVFEITGENDGRGGAVGDPMLPIGVSYSSGPSNDTVRYRIPNYNSFEILSDDFDSLDLDSIPWGKHYVAIYTGGTRRIIETQGTTLKAQTLLSSTTTLKKIAIRTSSSICIQREPLFGKVGIGGGNIVTRKFSDERGAITEIYIDRPRTFWGSIGIYFTDPDACEKDVSAPSACYLE